MDVQEALDGLTHDLWDVARGWRTKLNPTPRLINIISELNKNVEVLRVQG